MTPSVPTDVLVRMTNTRTTFASGAVATRTPYTTGLLEATAER